MKQKIYLLANNRFLFVSEYIIIIPLCLYIHVAYSRCCLWDSMGVYGIHWPVEMKWNSYRDKFSMNLHFGTQLLALPLLKSIGNGSNSLPGGPYARKPRRAMVKTKKKNADFKDTIFCLSCFELMIHSINFDLYCSLVYFTPTQLISNHTAV